jgi:hypothetical protein
MKHLITFESFEEDFKHLTRDIVYDMMKHLNTFESFNIDIYEHGSCEVFAFALHKELSYDMFFFLDEEAEFDDYETGRALIHAYVKDKNGNMIDATGVISKHDLENNHANWVSSPNTIQVDEDMYSNFVESGFLAGHTEDELSSCIEYIRQNHNKYNITGDNISHI